VHVTRDELSLAKEWPGPRLMGWFHLTKIADPESSGGGEKNFLWANVSTHIRFL